MINAYQIWRKSKALGMLADLDDACNIFNRTISHKKDQNLSFINILVYNIFILAAGS